jgi:hypothetical protein
VTGTVYLGAVEGFHMPLLEEEVPDDALRARWGTPYFHKEMLGFLNLKFTEN